MQEIAHFLFEPQSLSEQDMNLSAHPVPIVDFVRADESFRVVESFFELCTCFTIRNLKITLSQFMKTLLNGIHESCIVIAILRIVMNSRSLEQFTPVFVWRSPAAQIRAVEQFLSLGLTSIPGALSCARTASISPLSAPKIRAAMPS